jgi:hypothetical protein
MKCQAVVWVAEKLRHTGRGKSGFERHYTKRECKRPATNGMYCWQHLWMMTVGFVNLPAPASGGGEGQ